MGNIVPTISDAEIAARQPLSSSLMASLRDIARVGVAILESNSAFIIEGAVDSVTTFTITDADPTSESISRSGQFNGFFLRMTSGAVFTANNDNRFKITATSTLNTITVDTDLAAAGVLGGDTYEVLGHTHSGTDGAKIDFKNLFNIAENLPMTQALVDAIMDPVGLRPTVATRLNPLATTDDLVAASVKEYTQAGNQATTTTTATHTLIGLGAGTHLMYIYFNNRITGASSVSQVIRTLGVTVGQGNKDTVTDGITGEVVEVGGNFIMMMEDGDQIQTAGTGSGRTGHFHIFGSTKVS